MSDDQKELTLLEVVQLHGEFRRTLESRFA